MGKDREGRGYDTLVDNSSMLKGLHSNFKTIADICFMLGNYVDWRKSRTCSHVKITGQVQGHFGGFKVTRQGHELFCRG